MLTHCPDVTVLTTTREALGVPGEVQVPLGPLPTPPAGTPPAHVMGYPAAQLFAERARAVRPTLDLTGDADLAAVGDVVGALDGMPLAVELAAARASTLAPVELAARLTDRFGLLTSGARTADARQRTLRATVDWSHDLLSEPEQVVFRRLAVFHGGWTLDAAETVVAGPTCRGPTCSTCCPAWSTGTWSPSTTCIRVSRPGTGCWRPCGSTPSTSSAAPARSTGSRPRTSRTSAP